MGASWVLHGCFLGASWVLPGCFLLCTSSRRKHPRSTHHYLIMAGNSHQIGNLSRRYTWVLPVCFFLWHHQRGLHSVIKYSSAMHHVFQIKCSTFNSNPNWNVLMGQPSTARRGGRENGGGRKKELVQFLLRIYNGPHVANFTAKFRLQCMKCLLLPLCRPLRITYEEPSHLLYLFLASFAFPYTH